MSVEIIAEIGINHDGSLRRAKELVDLAVESGANTAKFQVYNAERVMRSDAPLANYMTGLDTTFIDLAKRYDLGLDGHRELMEYCATAGIEYLASPFDAESVIWLADAGVRRLKIPSGEAVNPFVLEAVSRTNLPVIMSTGMMTIDELRWSLARLTQARENKIVLLHCTSSYPATTVNANLRVVQTMRESIGVPVGYSDHTTGNYASMAAVCLGAPVLERHITYDSNADGPDHSASLGPDQFKQYVEVVRMCEQMLGDGIKQPVEEELELIRVARKSLVYNTDIERGTVLEENNLTAMRPNDGIAANDISLVIGRTMAVSVTRGQVVDFSHFS